MLQRMKVPPFDLGVLIHSAMDAAPELPQALCDHLSDLNNQIVQVSSSSTPRW